MTTLVIVESPGKIKKISSILGAGYRVMASVGHVRDLPKNDLGVDPATFSLHYTPTDRGKEVLAKLKAAVKECDAVLLATDPDREGEAIAWHLADALGLAKPGRVTFTAITAEKVASAVQQPRQIDMGLVHAQEARRALDRIFGYRVSPALSKQTGQQLSAGRVQSPAVRLVVDREREIQSFQVTEHYGVRLTFDGASGTWHADWDVKPHLQPDQKYLLDDALAQAVSAIRDVTVAEFSDSEQAKGPPAPFTTSTLQQVATQRLKMKPKQTMEVAQRLYEQGVITYHRTDNPNLDLAGTQDIAAYARTNNLPLSDKPRRFKAKEGAQEGHEAIRPAHVDQVEAGADDDERALYRLIWQRAVASQLADARFAVRSATLVATHNGNPVRFLAKGRTLLDPGWMALTAAPDDDGDGGDDENESPVPELAVGTGHTATDGALLTKHTKPPGRFKQSTLIAELERRGIGRPSTYAAILDNIITRRSYILEDKKGLLSPSPAGELVRDALVDRFGFVDLNYTRSLEEQLDGIAEAKSAYRSVVEAAWTSLDGELASLSSMEVAPAHPCPACGKALGRRKGSNGFFWGCSAYPECKTTLPDNKGKPGERRAAAVASDIPCPDCGQPLIRRQGTKAGRKVAGKKNTFDFYGCSAFPGCKTTFETGADGKPKLPAAAGVH